ncbi:hypothetical protein K458DRAFT_415900 [Lentithecium fluviatile CBS 122367]|uniref:HMG box domain-containing protein n=1 Tax=Lentithecium fluviatile CBS 122367 TaxID=1168545 RepID=A0A6G1J7Q3_9PLEO|nr:hypothetical protein K458DRAFT_415900 [Lentithecium fluviatile CBS 122367]
MEKNTQAMVPNSPPTPISASELDDSQGRTRSGRTIAPSSSPLGQEKPRPKATPKSRKAKGKADKPTTPKLNAPLSILTSKFTHIPVRNIEEWVNRPVEVRRKEVDKGNGYVKRPMNSFILYRSAYADRTKQWCLQNNHQVISSVAGQSWPLEPPEIRELYIEYAKIERINHQNAHPTYKFSPSKASTPARKRKGESSDDEPSDLDDAKWNPEHDVRSRLRHSRRPERALSYHMNGMSADYFDRSFGPNGHDMNKSSWEMTNEGRPVPMHLAQGDLYNQYYQNSMQPNMAMAGMEDMRLRRVDTPGASMQYSPEHGILGLPGGNAADIMQQMHSNAGTPLGEAQVDPMLLAYDGGHHHDVGATVQHPEFQNGHMGIMERELNQQSVDSLIAAGHGQEVFHPASWQPDPHMGHIDQESEFEKWMSDQ